VLKLIRDELRSELRNALYQAAQRGLPVNSAPLHVRTDEGSETVRIHVRPVIGGPQDGLGFLLVVFEPATENLTLTEQAISVSEEDAAQHLEEEVVRLRAQLRASNEQHEFQAEELKAGNEELQAMNEELRSATEELETSKEELQSINEELSTVNQELKVNKAGGPESRLVASVFLDITGRRQAEETLRQNENQFRTLANAVPQIIWSNEAGGKANYFNQRWYDYSGLSYEESYGPGWQAIVHPEDAPASIAHWQEALAAGSIFDVEYRLRRRDGAYRWFIGRNVPLHDKGGNITGWFGSATDIEELKEAQEAVRESAERLRITMESAVDYAIIGMNPSGIIESWSRGAERIFNWKEAEALDQYTSLIFTPEDCAKSAPEAELQTALAHGVALDERWHVRKDGTRFFMSGVVRPIYDGTLRGFVKVARDLTRERRGEELFRLNEERYRIALQSAEMGAWDWDVMADKVIWNEQHYHILGLPVFDTPGNGAAFLEFVHPDDLPYIRSVIATAINETGILQVEFRIIRRDNGEVRWMAGFARSVAQDENGRCTRMIGVMYDITERKRIEEQKEEFIGIASHELKTPLTSIKAYTEILEEILEDEANSEGLPLVQKLDEQIERLTELVRTLLDVTAMRAGRFELKKTTFNLLELLQEKAADIQVQAPQQLVLQGSEKVNVRADRERIGQVVNNLLANEISTPLIHKKYCFA